MQSKIKLSAYCIILTITVIVLLVAGCVFTLLNYDLIRFFVLLTVTMLLLFTGLAYWPRMLSADSKQITVRTPFWIHGIPMQDVRSVQLFHPRRDFPKFATVRVFASGGFMGYWGVFRDPVIGKFTAYYGKNSKCILIVMNDGKKYVVGCEDPEKMVEYIRLEVRG